ncbi:PREDICTED: metallophosphoesterase 1 [Papilio polytes]|uniref:metallophosphoesterase 1 n=1 Tax=Papilio polytes TaxID=76194 RepID=UPI00067644EE|nr:PREDICTED: metallophosphoesterase 1 [Papilio polytes]
MLLLLRIWGRKTPFTGILYLIIGLFLIYFYCEYIIYYVIQIQCGWPALTKKAVDGVKPVQAMVLADTHLLGSRNGHWFDKLRREWQMHRAFQTAMTIHQPEIIFVLGDLFDEGKWCTQKEFDENVKTFFNLFKVPDGTTMYFVAGNHDIGFHYSITPQLHSRFEKQLDAPPVKLVSLRGNHFVLINSMAMEGDGCVLCSRAVEEIDKIADILKCSSGSALCKSHIKLERYSQPIVMQHYPLYRESDSLCTEPDAAPLPERNNLFVERWHCLSKESTEYLVESLHPRAAFGAHTHHSCMLRHSFVPTESHKIEFVEYTVPSFSWGNRPDPKYYLLTVSPEEVKVSKCAMPHEWNMQVTAIVMFLLLLLYCKYIISKPTPANYKLLTGKKV